MNEQNLINGLKQIDLIVAACKDPALTREDHDNGRIIMQHTLTRIKLSYKLEAEVKKLKEDKEQLENCEADDE